MAAKQSPASLVTSADEHGDCFVSRTTCGFFAMTPQQ